MWHQRTPDHHQPPECRLNQRRRGGGIRHDDRSSAGTGRPGHFLNLGSTTALLSPSASSRLLHPYGEGDQAIRFSHQAATTSAQPKPSTKQARSKRRWMVCSSSNRDGRLSARSSAHRGDPPPGAPIASSSASWIVDRQYAHQSADGVLTPTHEAKPTRHGHRHVAPLRTPARRPPTGRRCCTSPMSTAD